MNPAAVPAVSILMPAYQVTRYIGEALDSVLAQTYRDFEVIVVNDGCPDTANLERVLEPYQRHIRYLKQENRGLAGARNTALRAARAPIIGLLDSDDLWEPNYLEVQVGRMHAEPDLAVLYCDALLFGDPEREGRTFMQLNPSTGDVTFAKLILQQCNVFVSAVVRRDAIMAAGMFDERLRSCEDWDLWLRIAKQGGRIAYHRGVLVRYRQRPTSLSADQVWMYSKGLDLLAKVESTLELTPEERDALAAKRTEYASRLHIHRAKRAFEQRDYVSAQTHVREANRLLHSPKLKAVEFALMHFPGLLLHVSELRRRLSGRYRPRRDRVRKELA